MTGIASPDISSPLFKASPYPFYARLRAEAPVYRTRLAFWLSAWLVTAPVRAPGAAVSCGVSLSRGQIVRALEALGSEMPDAHVELFVVGGAALVLLYQARESTKDVDAFCLGAAPASAIREAALRVAARLELPEDWLSDAAKGYVQGLALGPVLVKTQSLVFRTLAPEQLLAMKLSAWRDDVDVDDARLLLSKLAGSRETVWPMVEPYLVPGRELKARYAFDDLWEERLGTS